MVVRKRIGIFGWGVVAPKSPTIDAFETNLDQGGSWLVPFTGFGPSNFLVGQPQFDFSSVRPWLDQRFPPAKFSQLNEKMGPMVKYAIGAFIQSLSQNEGMEAYLQSLGTRCHIYLGTGLGDISVTHDQSLEYERVLRKWNSFWAAPDRCAPLKAHRAGDPDASAPADPDSYPAGSEEWINAKHDWEAFWAARSDRLKAYLAEAAAIQGEKVPPSSGTAKLSSIRMKLQKIRALNKQWACPPEPWAAVSPNLLWNIANIPAAQVSMIGKITGPAVAPVAACSTFSVALKMAAEAIHLGEAEAVVIGATDPPPHPMILSAFYNANVLAADGDVSRPLTGLKGTHISGGACVWIVGDADAMLRRGFKPLGLEIVGVGTSSDAHHIITPSKGGPQLAIQAALKDVRGGEVATWDMHATATPGDASEIQNSLELLHPDVIFTARKGTFGHGMGVGGGWELTAQHLGLAKGKLYPMALTEGDIHPDVQVHKARIVQGAGCDVAQGYAGKLSMGVGGINACVISRHWDPEYLAAPRPSEDEEAALRR